MSAIAEVRLWGCTIGSVSVDGAGAVASFTYTPDFQHSGVEVAPLLMPLGPRSYAFPALPRESFHGLPGMLADSLPDRFGSAIFDAWFAAREPRPAELNIVDRLRYVGSGATGALEFAPALGHPSAGCPAVRVDALVELASQVLQAREQLRRGHDLRHTIDSLDGSVPVCSGVGGSRAKAVIAWNPRTGEIRAGQVTAPPGFEPWIVKLDGVCHSGDRDLIDPQECGTIEYAYSMMAKAAGIRMSECRLLEENGRRHFMTRRFDRLDDGSKLHLQSLAALAHYDFNNHFAHSYEQAFDVVQRLGLPMDAVEELFRRMVFNVVARNQDDHVKNIAFLMNPRGEWSLSPAFDMTYAYNPRGHWTATHQMSLAGKRDGFEFSDLELVAAKASMRPGRAERITREVISAVRRWREFAAKARVPAAEIEPIAATHLVDLLPG